MPTSSIELVKKIEKEINMKWRNKWANCLGNILLEECYICRQMKRNALEIINVISLALALKKTNERRELEKVLPQNLLALTELMLWPALQRNLKAAILLTRKAAKTVCLNDWQIVWRPSTRLLSQELASQTWFWAFTLDYARYMKMSQRYLPIQKPLLLIHSGLHML